MHLRISEQQSGFIINQNISDGILITNEVAHSIVLIKCREIILKLDFAKAFGSVNRNFLVDAMKIMNFDPGWINWIKSILSSARSSILINGSPSKEFEMHQGLRQGDPISPLLFNIVGEMLHLLLVKAETLGIIKGISLTSTTTISHLQYADDTILFLKDDSVSIQGIKAVLTIFQAISSLKINFHKSFLYGSRDIANEINK